MGLFDGFPFQSKDEVERQRQDFEKRVFPLGLKQREAARLVLRKLIPHVKNDSELLFAFISSKDVYMINEQSEKAFALARAQMKKLRYFSEEDKDKIMALLLLDVRVSSLEEYPTEEDVLKKCRDLGAN